MTSVITASTCGASTIDRQEKYMYYQESTHKNILRIASWKSVVMYGLCISLAGHYVGWTVSLNAGFWEVFGITFIIGTATGCLMLCIAEMTAALPFSGGTYGVVRVTLGDLPGYLIGTCEVLQNVLYVAFTVGALAKYVTIMTDYDVRFEPLYWLVFYLTIGIITSNHQTLFWRSVWVFGVFMCVMLLLYCTITRTEDVNFVKYTEDPAVTNVPYNDEVYQFFKQLPLPSFFFNLSIKLLPLACREAKNPTSDVPMAMYIVYAVSIVSAFSVLFCASSIAPGVSVLRNFPAAPLSFGFSSIFNISMEQAVAFTMLSQYASCLGFTFAFTQQMAALSKSGFLWNSRKWGFVPDRYDNVVSLLVGCGFGYLLNVLIFYLSEDIRLYAVTLFRLLGYSINLVVFVTYIAFRNQFPSLMKKFRSPLGVPGAVYGLLMYLLVWGCIGTLSDVGNHWLPFVLLMGFLVIWLLPFFLYYRYHLAFSEEESTVMFLAYVIKANQTRRMDKLRRPNSSLRQSSISVNPNSSVVTSFRNSVRAQKAEEKTQEYTRTLITLSDQTKSTSRSFDEIDNSLSYTAVGTAANPPAHIALLSPIMSDAGTTPSGDRKAPIISSPLDQKSPVGPARVLPQSQPLPRVSRTDRVLPVDSPTVIAMSSLPQQQQETTGGGDTHYYTSQEMHSRAHTVDDVLTNELGYTADLIGQYRTELQEYYNANTMRNNPEGDEAV